MRPGPLPRGSRRRRIRGSPRARLSIRPGPRPDHPRTTRRGIPGPSPSAWTTTGSEPSAGAIPLPAVPPTAYTAPGAHQGESTRASASASPSATCAGESPPRGARASNTVPARVPNVRRHRGSIRSPAASIASMLTARGSASPGRHHAKISAPAAPSRRDLNQARRVRQTCVQGTGCATVKVVSLGLVGLTRG